MGLLFGVDVLIFVWGFVVFVEGVGEVLMFCELVEKWYVVLKFDVLILIFVVFCDLNLFCNIFKWMMDVLLNIKWENDCEKVVWDYYFEVEELMLKLVKYV